MALEIKKQSTETEYTVGSGEAQALARAETLVPGAGREAIEVLLADATVAQESADVQTDRMVVEGTVRCQAAYRQGNEATLRSVEAQTRISQVFDMPGAAPGMTPRACCTVEHVEARYENGHMVFLVTVSISARAYALVPAELMTGVESTDAVETQFHEISSCRITAESSAVHTLREESTLPAALDARTSLMEWGDVWVDSWESDLGGIKVKGRLNAETLISSGVEGRPAASVRNTFDFEQLVEVPEWLAGDVCAEAVLRRISTRVEQGGEREDSILVTEAEIGINVTSIGRDRISALTDAYAASGNHLNVTSSEHRLCSDIRCNSYTEQFKGTLLLSENAPGVGSVISVSVHPNISSAGTDGMIEGVLEATVLYMPGGSDRAASARSETPFSLKAPSGINDSTMICMKVLASEANTLMSDRVELKCSLGITAFTRDEAAAKVASEISEGDGLKKKPGIIIVWPDNTDTVWSIAKKYSLPSEYIASLWCGDTAEPGKAMVIKI